MKIYATIDVAPHTGCSSEDAVRGLLQELVETLADRLIHVERGKHFHIGEINVADEPPKAQQVVGA